MGLWHVHYAFESPRCIVCTYVEGGRSRLARLDTEAGRLEPVERPYSDISSLRADAGRVVFRGGSPTTPTSTVQLNLATGEHETLR